jgi:hypothetical protein
MVGIPMIAAANRDAADCSELTKRMECRKS